ncbi:urease subunit gamma [Ureaplasma zalophigenitalium]|uniref:Urease subunit gamma n=1 Tax=Ureaplasma zalophigenitalium TaxID=907723 RepID=A0ABT3BPP2_9BACT|nr:urease subunit gamma [Ureaplasma zalophigenitalium]MCV3754201.1 urease subunit gamma [Ureaplasma zalophigenitalium]
MNLSLREIQKLMITVAADVARRRLARGLKLNYSEAVALITDHVVEGARDGALVSDLMQSAREILRIEQVMEGVDSMVSIIQVEVTFPDGTKLVSIHDPIYK